MCPGRWCTRSHHSRSRTTWRRRSGGIAGGAAVLSKSSGGSLRFHRHAAADASSLGCAADSTVFHWRSSGGRAGAGTRARSDDRASRPAIRLCSTPVLATTTLDTGTWRTWWPWSYDLLTPNEQRLFIRLSIFAGSFDPDAVDAVCAIDDGPTDLLFGLVDRSMVQVADIDEPRYHLLETLREFGRTRLDEADATPTLGERHLSWYLDLAERASMEIRGPGERAWSDRIERDFDNLRAAHAFAIQSGSVDAALRLVVRDARVQLPQDPLRGHVVGCCCVGDGRGRAARRLPRRPGDRGVWTLRPWRSSTPRIAVGHAAVDAAERLDVDGGGLAERTLGNSYFYLGQTSRTRFAGWIAWSQPPERQPNRGASLTGTTCVRSPRTSVGRVGARRHDGPRGPDLQQTPVVRRRRSHKPATRWVSLWDRTTLARSRGRSWHERLPVVRRAGDRLANEAFARTEVL